MKVGSLFAEIGFKVDESGLEKFSNAMKSFQKTIREGLKELKAYARAAKEISQAMREAYVPNQAEARSRFRAETAHLRSQSRVNNAWSKRERVSHVASLSDAYLKAQRAKFFEQDSNTRANNARARLWGLDQKERGLIGTHTGRFSAGIKKLFSSAIAFNIGGMLGGIGSMFGPIGAVVGAAIEKLIGAMWKMATWLGRTFMQGIRTGLAYRDYRTFTGRNAKGLSDLLYGSFNTTSLSPEDILKDAANFEKGFWDIYFGGGNIRPWQALGITPTGIGDEDMRNVLASIYNVPNRGLQRKLLSDFGLSDDYLNLIDSIQQKEPDKNFSDVLDTVLDTIDSVAQANFQLKEFGWKLDAVKVKIVDAIVKSGLLDALEKMSPVIQDILTKLVGILEKLLPKLAEFLDKLTIWLGEKLMTPEQQLEYKRAKNIVNGVGRERFLEGTWLDTVAKGATANKYFEKGEYLAGIMKTILPGPATTTDRYNYFKDTFNISIADPDDLPKVFEKIKERTIDLPKEAGIYNNASANSDITQ